MANTDHSDNEIKFDEINIASDYNKRDLVKVSSWPNIDTSFDTSIFGRLPNLGGKLFSEMKATSMTSRSNMKNNTAQGLTVSSSRIPQKITSLPVTKLADDIAKLNTKTSNSGPFKQKQPVTTQQVTKYIIHKQTFQSRLQ